MSRRNPLKIVLIGDYNFSQNAHHATNISIDHVSQEFGFKIDYFWIRTYEANKMSVKDFESFDGIWITSGPFENSFFLHNIIRLCLNTQKPIFITGEGFKAFIEIIATQFDVNPNQEKCISENLIETSKTFSKIEVEPLSDELKLLYNYELRQELTNSQFSIYPSFLEKLKKKIIDVEAINQFDEPEVISLKTRKFCCATMSLPQVCSTRNAPHPLITAFLNYAYLATGS